MESLRLFLGRGILPKVLERRGHYTVAKADKHSSAPDFLGKDGGPRLTYMTEFWGWWCTEKMGFQSVYDTVCRADFLNILLVRGVLFRFIKWIKGFLLNKQARVRLNCEYGQTGVF